MGFGCLHVAWAVLILARALFICDADGFHFAGVLCYGGLVAYMYIVFNLGRGIMYDWFGSLAGLHVARGPCTFGSVALHLAQAFLNCGYGIV